MTSLTNNPLIALNCSNYRYFWSGQLISLIGRWIQTTAFSWLILTVTKSPFLVGLFNAAQFMPELFLSLFAGALADRYPKKRLLLLTQSSLMVCAIIFSVLIKMNLINYTVLLIFALLLGTINAFDTPTRQSFIVELVEKDILINAVALHSLNFNLARVVGPAIAGLLLKHVGMSLCFLLYALSISAVLISLCKIKAETKTFSKKKEKHILTEITEGLRYMRSRKTLFQILLMVMIMNVFIMNYNALIPLYTNIVLKKDEAGFGFLLSSMGIGAMMGALVTATIGSSTSYNLKLNFSMYCLFVIFILLGLNKTYLIGVLLYGGIGFFMVMFSTTANSTLQLSADEYYRGRIMSLYILASQGAMPLANFLAGSLAQFISVSGAYIGCGGMGIVISIVLWFIFNSKKHCDKNL